MIPPASSSYEASADYNFQRNNLIAPSHSIIAGGFLFGRLNRERRALRPRLYFYGEEIAMSARLWTSGFNISPQIAYCCFISTRQNIPIKSMQPPIGAITAIGTITTFTHSNVYTHCSAVSTTHRHQSAANELGELKPLDWEKRSLLYQQWAGLISKRQRSARPQDMQNSNPPKLSCPSFIAIKKRPAGTLALMLNTWSTGSVSDNALDPIFHLLIELLQLFDVLV